MEIINVDKQTLAYAKEAMRMFMKKRAFNPSFFDNLNNHMVVACEQGEVIGMVYGYTLEAFDSKEKQCFIYSIDVRDSFQQQGVGKALINGLLASLGESVTEAFVMTNVKNEAAMALYTSTKAKRASIDDNYDVLFVYEGWAKA